MVPVKKALSLANGGGGKFGALRPKRYIQSGQRQRADSMYSQNYGMPGNRFMVAQQHEVLSQAAASIYGGQRLPITQARALQARKQPHSQVGYHYPSLANKIVRAESEVDRMSHMTGTRSQLIRQRGQLPKTIWQRGAMFSTKKSRKEISMGQSPLIKKKAKFQKRNTVAIDYISDLNRMTHGSFAGLGQH